MINNRTQLVKDIAAAINRNSVENHSNTPDFILAEYLVACLETLGGLVHERDAWYGLNPSPGNVSPREAIGYFVNKRDIEEKAKIRFEAVLEPLRNPDGSSRLDEDELLEETVRLVLEEREACAQICEHQDAETAARAIRGTPKQTT